MGRCSACATCGRCLAWYGAQNLTITQGNPHILAGSCSDEPVHAVANYEWALAALQHLPENPDTMRQAIDLHLTVRVVLHPLGTFNQILPHLRAAERLAEALGDPHFPIRAAISNMIL